MKSIFCDVVILPEPRLASKAISVSQKLSQLDSYYTLEDGRFFPHASLYMLKIKVEDIPRVVRLLSDIAQTSTAFRLEAYRYEQSMGFIYAEYGRTLELDELQNQVVKALNPIRNDMRAKDKERMLTAEGIALRNFQKYGYKYVGELFSPHISLTRFKESNESVLNELENIAIFNGTFPRLGIFEMGNNGTCIREIETFDLKA